MPPSEPHYRYGERPAESHARAQKARQLRRDQTPPEGILWSKLRNRQLDGLKIRRQHPVGPYVLDFFCEEIRLGVEVDGQVHGTQRERDARRDNWLAKQGIRVLRFGAGEVTGNVDGVLEGIRRVARALREEAGKKE